ncbi:MAG TPA: SEL1-like repeat protein, partial [Verrucomicrobiae bacterium]|nr:SEL1-like repeat protein [Verrucomicrobiae bacterium]
MMDVEQAFDDCVESVGGELVKKLLPKSPPFDNADYLFRNQQSEPVVAELKCLTKDLLKEGYQEKLDSLFDDWINRRLIPPFWGQHKFNSRDLPPVCQNELFSLLGRRIKKDAGAEYWLGYCYGVRDGVPKDYVQAYKWFNLASAQGNQTAKANLSIVEQSMTPEQIAEAQQLSTAFVPQSEAQNS